jgi:hypothetical protein
LTVDVTGRRVTAATVDVVVGFLAVVLSIAFSVVKLGLVVTGLLAVVLE